MIHAWIDNVSPFIALQVWIQFVRPLIVIQVSIDDVSWITALYEWFDDNRFLITLIGIDNTGLHVATSVKCMNWWC